jgi:hypothetical protein
MGTVTSMFNVPGLNRHKTAGLAFGSSFTIEYETTAHHASKDLNAGDLVFRTL